MMVGTAMALDTNLCACAEHADLESRYGGRLFLQVCMMSLQCPNCRTRVSFFRAFATPSWGSFTCKSCGSVLTISFARRMIAAGTWLVLLITASEGLGLYRWGRLASYGIMFASFFLVMYLSEKVVLLDRRAFTCEACGYDLQGLPEDRCPECGTRFDPGEIAKIRARLDLPPPKPRRLLPVIVLILLSIGVAAGFVAWRNAAASRPATMPTTRATSPVTP